MKRNELKKEYRDLLATDHNLRCAIGADIITHQQTIQRWATNNSPKLCTSFFIKALRKYALIDKTTELINIVPINQAHELVA